MDKSGWAANTEEITLNAADFFEVTCTTNCGVCPLISSYMFSSGLTFTKESHLGNLDTNFRPNHYELPYDSATGLHQVYCTYHMNWYYLRAGWAGRIT